MRAEEQPPVLSTLCHQFAIELEQSKRPQIEAYLQRCSEKQRGDLFRELLVLEIRHKASRQEPAGAESYLLRFNPYADIIEDVFNSRAVETIRGIENSPDDVASTENRVPPTIASTAESPKALDIQPQPSRFRPLSRHAQGGLGEVFLAEDLELHRKVALKQIRRQFSADMDSRFRFIQEAEITGSLEHPGIVPVYGFGMDEHNRPYYAMRFIHGQSLKEAIDQFHAQSQKISEHSLEFRKLLRRFMDVCNAMEYAHSRGVLHRDLKPSNVMLGRFGETLIVDWGLAKMVGIEETSTTDSVMRPVKTKHTGNTPTVMGTVVGTPAYMSPEQAAGKVNELTSASDVYSLGAILFHILTGRPPLVDSDMSLLLERIQHGDIPRPRQVRPDIPRPLDAICIKAMHAETGKRYASGQALAEDIERWLGDEPVTAYREGIHLRLGRWVRRNASLVSSMVVASVLLIILGVVAWIGHERAVQRVLNSVQTDRRLVRNEVYADRLGTAEAILDKTVNTLRKENVQPQLLVALERERQQVHQLIEFKRLADQAWFMAGEERDHETMATSEAAIKALGIRNEPQWWKRLDRSFDLTAAQRRKLAVEVHRLLLLQATVLTKVAILDLTIDATDRCKKVLVLIDWAERFEPSAYTRLLENFCHFRMGNADNIKPLSGIEPSSASDYFFFGFIYLWMASFPDDAASQLVKQMVHKVAGMEFTDEMAKAQAYFRRAAEIEPDRYWHHFMVALAQFAGQDLNGADLALNACIALRPDSVWAHSTRANLMMISALRTNDGQLRKRGEELFARCLTLDPESSDVFWLRANRLAELSRHEEAQQDLIRYLQIEPLDTPIDIINQQIADYCKGLAAKQIPETPLSHLILALVSLKLNKLKDALNSAEEAAKDAKHRPLALAIQGHVQLQRTKLDDAEQQFQAAIKADPGNYLAMFGQGLLFEKREDYQAALSQFESLAKIASLQWQLYEAHSGRARALEKLGRKKDAAAASNDALRFATEIVLKP